MENLNDILHKINNSSEYNSHQKDALVYLLNTLDSFKDSQSQLLLSKMISKLDSHLDKSQVSSNLLTFSVNTDSIDQLSYQHKEAMLTPCSYLTFQGSVFNITSLHYHYANSVQNTSICSHPDRRNSSQNISYCTFMSDQCSCPDYSYVKEVLATATIPRLNSTRIDEYQLVYTTKINFFDSSFFHVFSIINVSTSDIVNEISISDESYEDSSARSRAHLVFAEYVQAYDQSSLNLNFESTLSSFGSSPKDISSTSYFSHMLSTN